MRFKKYIIGILSALFLIFIILKSQGNIGVLKDSIEKDARKQQNIPEEWITVKDISNNFGALLFYQEDLNNFTFSIYVNRSGLSFGYNFRSGGSLLGISDGVLKITTNTKEDIFLSLNRIQISKIEINNGINTKEILLENNKPFTVIIPENSGEIKFYDTYGDLITDSLIIETTL